jgi:hypothetical protein
MKKVFKFVGIIAFAAVIGFSLVTCAEDTEDNTPYDDYDYTSSYNDPPLTGSVSITGIAAVEQTLTANITGLDGYGTVTYQWKRGTTDIGTNSNTYVVVEADKDSTIKVIVTRAGYSGSKEASTTVVTAALALTGSVTITGDAIVGKTLRANISGLNVTTGTFTYQWKAGTDIVGTDSSTYVVAESDIGKTITVTVTRESYTGSQTSTPTTAVVRPYWTVITNSTFGDNIIHGIDYGSNKFVAVGGTSSGKMAYSADGKTWTAVDTNSAFGTSLIMDVAYGSKWVAVGGQGKMASSSDGITWTAVANSTFSSAITAVATNLNYWVAAGYDGKMARSTNGETWTAVANSTFGSDTINCVATGMLHSSFVAVGASGKIACSNSDGTTWTAVANSTFGTTAINSVAYSISLSNFFVAVGNSGKIAYSSDDGYTWTAVTNSPFGTTAIRSVVWNGGTKGYGGMFVAVGNEGKAAYSADGITWTAVTDGSFGYNDIYDIAFNNSLKMTGVAVGSGGKIAYNLSE